MSSCDGRVPYPPLVKRVLGTLGTRGELKELSLRQRLADRWAARKPDDNAALEEPLTSEADLKLSGVMLQFGTEKERITSGDGCALFCGGQEFSSWTVPPALPRALGSVVDEEDSGEWPAS